MEKERPVETDKSLPLGFKVMIVVNIIAVLGIGAFAHRAGGFVSGVFPPDHRPAAAPAPRVMDAAPQRAEVPLVQELQPIEPMAKRWEFQPDGSVRFAN